MFSIDMFFKCSDTPFHFVHVSSRFHQCSYLYHIYLLLRSVASYQSSGGSLVVKTLLSQSLLPSLANGNREAEIVSSNLAHRIISFCFYFALARSDCSICIIIPFVQKNAGCQVYT